MARIGRYKVLELLGRGGAGEVYRVRDLARGGRMLALKRIRAQVDENLRAALEREFAIMASLSVFGIAEVHDFGVAEPQGEFAGGAFFTRSFVEGVQLDEAAAELSVSARLGLFARLCAVIAPLHRIGVVHGDLKPGNVVVSERGDVSVIDFGLSRLLGGGGKDGAVAGGTPPFMAPENLHGAPMTIASDVYALGTMLFQLITGELPFVALGPRATQAKLRGDAPTHGPLLDQAGVSAMTVAQRALKHDPLDRYPNVTELLQALLPLVPESRRPAPPPFVPPRPRGRGELVEELQMRLAAVHNTANGSDTARIVGVLGEQGAGKSVLLRELKWRLQLNGIQVVELFVAEASGRAVLPWLLRQLQLLAGGEPTEPASAGVEDIIEALQLLASGKPTLLFLDDLDLAEPALGELLRVALHDERMDRVGLLFTAADGAAQAPAALGSAFTKTLAALPPRVVAALSTDVLGAVDASVLAALSEFSRGIPAILMEALSKLSHLSAPTVADVVNLPPGHAGATLARARLSLAGPAARPLLILLAIVHRVPRAMLPAVLGEEHEKVLARLQSQGLVTAFEDELRFFEATAAKTLLADLGPATVREEASALLARLAFADMDSVMLAQLAVAADDVPRMRAVIPKATRQLRQGGSALLALRLGEALLPHVAGEAWVAERLSLGAAQQALGEHAAAVEHARAVLAASDAGPSERAQARLIAARGLTALAQFDAAVEVLDGAATDERSPLAPRILQELSRLHMRRGSYDAAEEAADRGLQLAPPDALPRAELLCTKGLIEGYRDRPELAQASYEEALRVAQAAGTPADVAKVLSYLAIGCHRAGELGRARELFTEALSTARQVMDFALMANASLNLGAILFYLGDPGASERHYASASRLARRGGSRATDLQARNNLAHVHVHIGLYEQAREELSGLSDDAERAGHRYVQAQLNAVLGDLHARTGDLERSLIAYDDAIARYTQLGQLREAAEHHQDAAEALLERDGPADVSAAVGRLSAARALIETHQLSELRLRQELLTARGRLARGDAEEVLEDLNSILQRCEQERSRGLLWMALATAASAHMAVGAEVAGMSYLRRAVEVLEAEALRLPREYRDAFWHDPRRRRVRAMLAKLGHETPVTELGPNHGGPLSDPRLVRLLDIVKRLAAEHDLDRLLERIVDSAVELSAAERGYVLLVDAQGQLEPHVARGRTGPMEEASIAFSRSIAEAVLIDGDSIVTTDATDDGRLRGYASVHELTLRSVACLPIRSAEGTVGVLYLEHRRSRGRFNEASVELLNAFADQAAIAVQNARLLAENLNRQEALESANRELAVAKQQLEEALSARMEQLHDVQRELHRANARGSGRARHGIVGHSDAMRRVWTMIDRLKDATVPVIIRGESGTGKELVARAIHYAGVRQKEPFVALNSAALPESLLESELFGHVRGAFSGAERDKEGLIARAHGGTLFLDEVSDMPPKMQLDLLRVLQEGTVARLGSQVEERVSVRFLAASQRDLKELVDEGTFREDLYYRLNVVELPLPPLRERREDLPALCHYFLSRFKTEQGLPEKVVTPEALRALMAAELRGNVRELEHRLMQAVLMSDGGSLTAADLGLAPELGAKVESQVEPKEAEVPVVAVAPTNVAEHRDHEKQRILQALEDNNWNRAKTAKALGMARRTFYRRLQEYEILQ